MDTSEQERRKRGGPITIILLRGPMDRKKMVVNNLSGTRFITVYDKLGSDHKSYVYRRPDGTLYATFLREIGTSGS